MSASVNKVILLGNLGADPELRATPSGQSVCQMSVATNRSWVKDDQRQEKVSWHRVVAWGKTGELCKQYLSKGRQVYVEGRLETDSYLDKSGARRSSTKVVSDVVKFLGGGKRDGHEGAVLEEPPGDSEDRRGAADEERRHEGSVPDAAAAGDDLPF